MLPIEARAGVPGIAFCRNHIVRGSDGRRPSDADRRTYIVEEFWYHVRALSSRDSKHNHLPITGFFDVFALC